MRLILLLISMIFVSSCSNNQTSEEGFTEEQKKEQAELTEEVMAIHDEVMPLMGKMIKYRKQAKNEADLLLQDSSTDNDERAMELENLAIELDAAAESMMVWMRAYNPDFDSLQHKEVIEYLSAEKVRISEVSDDINNVMSRSKELLGIEE